jgi:hypothetical protein
VPLDESGVGGVEPTGEAAVCDSVPVLCNAVPMLCDAVPMLCDAVPVLCDAVPVLCDAVGETDVRSCGE